MGTPFVSDYLRVVETTAEIPADPTVDPGTHPEMVAFCYDAEAQTLSFWDPISSTRLTVLTTGGSLQANDVEYDGAGSGLAATNVQAAIDELDTAIDALGAPPTDEYIEDLIGGILGVSLVYVDGTPLIARAALTGDVTAAQDDNATTIAADAVTNAKLANMAAWTIKANNTSGSANPTDAALADITEEAAPAAGDFLLGFLASGEIRLFDVDNLPATAAGMELIGTASPSGTAVVTFAAIAAWYSALKIIGMGRSTTVAAGAAVVGLQFNNDTGGNYHKQVTIGTGTGSAGDNQQVAQTSAAVAEIPLDSNLTDMPGYFEILIPFYDKTTYGKGLMSHYGFFLTGASSGLHDIMGSCFWASTAAITEIDLTLSSGNWKAGSELRLYGIP